MIGRREFVTLLGGMAAGCAGAAAGDAPRYLIRDQDKIYGVAVPRRLRAMSWNR